MTKTDKVHPAEHRSVQAIHYRARKSPRVRTALASLRSGRSLSISMTIRTRRNMQSRSRYALKARMFQNACCPQPSAMEQPQPVYCPGTSSRKPSCILDSEVAPGRDLSV